MPTPWPKPAPRIVNLEEAAAPLLMSSRQGTARVRMRVRARIRTGWTATLARHDRRGEVSGNGAQGVGPVRGVPGGGGGRVRLRDPGRGDARPQRVARRLLCRLHPGAP